MILRNAKAEALKDAPNAWPGTIEIEGFNYARLGGITFDSGNDIRHREVDWFREWLSKQEHYSPQPYEHLANVLRNTGHQNLSTQILYTGKERERSETPWSLSSGWQTLLYLFIGHGYVVSRVLLWALGAVALGMGFLRVSGQYADHHMKYWGLAYSINMLIPILELHRHHTDCIDLEGRVRVYFYFHKAFGYILSLFLIGAMTGLVK